MGRPSTTKKRSIVAALISFIGSIVMVIGLYFALAEIFIMVTSENGTAVNIILGILLLVLSAFIQYGSVLYDQFREHRKWVNRLKNAGIEEELASSDELAWQAYRSNPTGFSLRYIEAHNPNVAADIRAYLEESRPTFLEKLTGRGKRVPPVKVHVSSRSVKTEFNTNQDWRNDDTIIR